MALVRISKDLINQVEGRISQLRGAEVRELPCPNTNPDAKAEPRLGLGAVALATPVLWGEHLHLQHIVPVDWLLKVNRLCLHTQYVHDDGSRENTAQITVDCETLVTPPGTSVTTWNNATAVAVPYDAVEQGAADPEHPAHLIAKEIMSMVNYEKNQRKVNKAWYERRQQIVLFLNKCKSLNEAIKLWPEVKLYVPQHFIDTVETPVVRPQNVVRKERALENVDTDGLTAAAIAARLAGVI